MSKNLKIIQTVMKVLKILSKIGFICCVIGSACCVISAIFLLLGNFNVLPLFEMVIDGKTVKVLIVEAIETDLFQGAASCISSSILCAASAVVCKLQYNYFEKELDDGDPFTKEGADLLQKVAIKTIIITLASYAVAAIVFFIMTLGIEGAKFDIEYTISLVSPISLLFISVIFGYGAEVKANQNTNLDL